MMIIVAKKVEAVVIAKYAFYRKRYTCHESCHTNLYLYISEIPRKAQEFEKECYFLRRNTYCINYYEDLCHK